MLLTATTAACLVARTPIRAESSDDWMDWANIAWSYFQPSVGVNSNTGLHYPTSGWHRFTDWDVGVYVDAIMDAEKLGIVSREGTWGSDFRIERVLSFLETRQLTSDGLPYAQYDAETGKVPSDIGSKTAHQSDSGKMLIALGELRNLRPGLTTRINALVARHNFTKFAESNYFSGNDVYPFYAAQGYRAFGYSTPALRSLNSLGVGGKFVDVYGIQLPLAHVTSEPLVWAILENHVEDPLYRTYADRAFTAQQKRYEATGKLTAFSEGSYWDPHNFVWELIVNWNGETWVIYASGKINVVPLAYAKLAFAFHAIYHTQYTALLVNEFSSMYVSPSGGFYEGKSEQGATLGILSDKTNGMILAAARYYLSSSQQKGFELHLQPSNATVIRGGKANFTVQLARIGLFSEEVALSLAGLPAGASYLLDRSQATPPATVDLQITASPKALVGSYVFSVNGASKSVSNSASATLMVRSLTTTTLQLESLTVSLPEKVKIVGSTGPPRVAAVTLYVSFNGSTWTKLKTVYSSENGIFRVVYSPPQLGTYVIKAEAAESEYYLASESPSVTFTAVPEFAFITTVAIMLLAVLLLVRCSMTWKPSSTPGRVIIRNRSGSYVS